MVDVAFDHQCFEALVEDVGGELAQELLGLFLAETQRVIATCTSLDGGSREAIARHAHSLKSSAATFGFRQFSAAARRLEIEATTLPTSELTERLRSLKSTFAALDAAVVDLGRPRRQADG